jgi:hypothetical protein
LVIQGGCVERASGAAVVPLRPLTVGELLDSSVAVLRTAARPLLALGALLALAEQALLTPLWYVIDGADIEPVLGYLVFALGLGTEATILALLAAPAARAAAAAMQGQTLGTRTLLTGRENRWGATTVVALLVGTCTGAAALACTVPWLAVYGFAGLAVPALVLERIGPGAAVQRSMRLSWPWVFGIRLLGYLAWLMLRLALGLAGRYVLVWLGLADTPWVHAAGWLVANAVAYPALACLDAALYLQARIRTEGLDIAMTLARLERTGAAR